MGERRRKEHKRRAKPEQRRKKAAAAPRRPREGERSYGALLESEQRYKQLFEVASDWFWEMDAEGRLTYVSANIEKVLGLPASAYIGKRLAETEGVTYAPAAGRATLVAFKARQPFRDFLYSRKLPDGKVVWVNSSGGPFYAEDGRFVGYRGVARDVTTQVEAELRLKMVERRFGQLFEDTSDSYWEQDTQGRLTYLSPSFENSTGIPAAELLGKRINDVSVVKVDPRSGARALAAVKARLPYRDLIHTLTAAGGRLVHVLTSGIPIYDENGAFRGYCGISKDITAQVEVERALLESEQRYKQLFEVASDWFWETDTEGRLTYVSANIEKVLRLPVSAYIGKRLAETEGVTYEPEAGRATLVAFKARQPYRDFIYSRKLPDGKLVWISSSGGPFFGKDGAFLGYRGVARDVTSQVEAERRLKTVERRFRQLFEDTPDSYWEQDAAGRLTYLSPAFERSTGISAAELLGKRLGQVAVVRIDPESGAKALAAVRARSPFHGQLHTLTGPNGRLIHVLTSGVPIYEENGEFRGYCGISKDITAQVEAEHARRQSEQRFRELFEIASDYFWETDRDKRITYVSENYEKVFGIPRSEVLGKRLTDAAGVSVDPEMGKMVFGAIKARRPYRDFVYSRRFPSGETRWFKISGVPIFGVDGEFQGYRGVGADMTAHVEADQAVRLAQSRLHDAVAYVTQPFVFYDAEHRATAFNQAFTDLHREPGGSLPIEPGVTYRALAEWQLRVGFYAAGPEEEEVTLDQLFDRYENVREHTYHLRDGRWMLVVYRRLPGGGSVGLWTEVTAIKHAERALRNSEQRFRELFEIASDYFWEADEHQRITYLSENYETVFGVPRAQTLGKRLTETPGVSVDPEMGKMAIAAIRARRPYRDFLYSRKFPDGKTRWFKTSGIPTFGADGTFLGYRGVGADLTAHVEAEQAARLAQSRLHDAVAHVTQPFVFYDAEHRATGFNQAFTDLHREPGGTAPVAQGVSFRDLAEWQLRVGFYAAGPDEGGVSLDLLLDRYEHGGEHSYQLRDGRWMLVVYRRLPGGGRVGLWTDVTAIKRVEAERRVLEGQLQHAQRLESLGTLAGGVAHEINNALVPVIALTKMVANKLPEGRERRNLDTVVGAAERSRDLVKQILAFSRKEEAEEQLQSIDLATVLREALRLLRASLPATIGITEAIMATPAIRGNQGQLHQVIVNLVTNAAQAIGDAHGTITVGLAPDAAGSHLCLSIRDTGCGMDAATQARIFEPFFTTKTVGQGTGLGLAVVHGIVAQHGGRIEVESAPGRGTRFDVILPLEAAEAGAAA